MKTLKTFFALSLFALTLNSCDAIEDAAPDITVEDDFKTSIAIDTQGENSIDTNFNIDASGNADFQKYKSKIKSVDITGFTYEITAVTSGEGSVLNGALTSDGKTAAISNLTIAVGEGGTITQAQSDFFNALAQDLKADGKASVAVSGSLNNETGAKFTLLITPTVKFIFSVL
ncbi:hypothetical protein [Leeuwenhoekiella parthenopeia]|uniref:Lipoprotein n=1 Tax=Leeuwenhoekiella parthenopeia TaxID=2890320 RepID=A0ABS8GNC8_9FLAO|nr:hypothetical protein [Leeuwenhoekiella parthenopeia]MCC4211430.1 hypothetical protein [Leeuwenhoekiella parthenopeia]